MEKRNVPNVCPEHMCPLKADRSCMMPRCRGQLDYFQPDGPKTERPVPTDQEIEVTIDDEQSKSCLDPDCQAVLPKAFRFCPRCGRFFPKTTAESYGKVTISGNFPASSRVPVFDRNTLPPEEPSATQAKSSDKKPA